MHRIRRHLTYANVMSTIAMFAVLAGGGAWAAARIGTNDIKNGAVTAEKLHRDAVTTQKIKNNAVTGAKVDKSTLGAVPRARIGESPVAYAHVLANGTVDQALSRGLSSANVVADPPGSDPGTYCLRGLAGIRSAMVVADTTMGNHHATIRVGGNLCPGVAGVQFSVATFGVDASGDDAFFIWFFN